MKQKLVTILIALLASFGIAFAQSPVSCYGKLKVDGNKIVGAKTGTTAVQVKGVSFGWNNEGWESSNYFKANVVGAMVDQWRAEIVRAPNGAQEYNGYLNGGSQTNMDNKIYAVVDAAIAKGVYVIIDWHSHTANTEQSQAVAWLGKMAQKYGSNDHVIFEVFNEPINQDWSTIRTFANAAITEIRKYSDNLILVGTPAYSAWGASIGSNKCTDSKNNVAYVMHFYAATHALGGSVYYNNQDKGSFQSNVQSILNSGSPVFISEWGTVTADGAGSHNGSASDTWMTFLDQNKISWCAWQISHKSEASAWFNGKGDVSSKAANDTWWGTKSNFNASGQYIFDKLASHYTNAAWRSNCGCSTFYTVKFSTDGGGTIADQSVCTGTKATKPSPEPTKTGYSFEGWYSDAALTTKFDFATTNITKAITLYAKWKQGAGPTTLADCETDKTNLCTVWYTGVGPNASFASSVPKDIDGNIIPSTGGNPGKCLAVTYSLPTTGAADNYKNWGCMVGFSLSDKTTEKTKVPVDITGALSLQLDYKASRAVVVQVEIDGKGQYELEIATSSSWKTVNLSLTDGSFIRTNWDVTPAVTYALTTADLAKVTDIAFSFKSGSTAANSQTFSVDNIILHGVDLPQCAVIDPCEQVALYITEAETLYATYTKEGTAPGECASGSRAKLNTAISAAKSPACTSSTAESKLTAIKKAISDFKAGIVPPNNNTLIADCEDKNVTKLLTYWSSYADGSGATITPLSNATTDFTMTAGGANSTNNAAVVTGKLGVTGDPTYSSAGIGFNMTTTNEVLSSKKVTNASECALNLTGATGIGFWHKGDGITFNVMITSVTAESGFDFQISVPSSTSWQYVVAAFPGQTPEVTGAVEATLAQASWVATAEQKTFDASLVYKLQWQVKDGANNRTFGFSIDEVSVIGKILESPRDLTALEAKIAEATALHTAAKEGTGPGEYASGSKKTLNDAITAATTAKTSKDQKVIDAAVVTLQAAIDAFKTGMVPDEFTILTDCEEARTNMGTYWYAFADKDNGGASTTKPAAGGDFTMATGGKTGNYAKLEYTLGKGTLTYDPFAGMGFAMSDPKAAYDLSKAKGVSFWYKGPSSRLKVVTSDVNSSAEPNAHGYVIPASPTEWTFVTVTWAQLTQEAGWGTTVAFNSAHVIEFQWQVQGADKTTGTIGVDGFQVDGVKIVFRPQGMVLDLNTYGEDPNEYQVQILSSKLPNVLVGQALKKGDKITVTLQGTSKYAITGLQAVIVNETGAWKEKTDYVQFGNIAANTAFNLSATLTVSEDAAGSSYKLVISGVSPTAKTAGETMIALELQGIEKDQYTVAYEANQEGVYKLDRYDSEENRGTFARFPAGTPALKVGDKVKITMEGSAKSDFDYYGLWVSLLDQTPAASYWLELSADPWANEDYYMMGTRFKYEIILDIATAPKGTGDDSQVILLQDFSDNRGYPATLLYLDVFTAEVICCSTPPLDYTALTTAINTATSLAVASNSCANGGKYPAAAITALQTAITTAQGAQSATTQVAIDNARDALNTAISTFNAAEIKNVSKTNLASAITAAQAKHDAAVEGTLNGQYKAGSKSPFQTAINAAKAVNTDACVLQAAVDAALTALNTAETNFDKEKVVIDPLNKAPLEAAITAATPLAASTSSCVNGGKYPAADVDVLSTALSAARNVLTTASTQGALDNATGTLNTAISTLQSKEITTTKTDLATTISTAENRLIGAVEGTANGQYAAGSIAKLQDAINAAKTVNTNACLLQAVVDGAVQTLTSAIAAFDAAKISVDKKALADKITEATQLRDDNAGKIGDGDGQYPQAAYDALKDAITVATAEYNSTTSTASTVSAATTAITDAIAAFKASVNSVNKTELAALITTATTLRTDNAGKVGDGDGQYPQAAYTAFGVAITAANQVNDNKGATQTAVDAAVDALNAAIDAFKKSVNSVDKTELAAAIAEIQPIYDNAKTAGGNGHYDLNAKIALGTALDAAKVVNNNPAATQTMVDAALAALVKAKDAMLATKVTTDKAALADAIKAAKELAKSPVGDEAGQYPSAAMTALNAAITAAEGVYVNEDATQATINTAIKDLQDAMTDFSGTIIPLNKSALTQALNTAESVRKGAVIGGGEGEYPQAAADEFDAAIAEAKGVLATATTNKAITDAAAELNEARLAFLDAVNGMSTKPLEDAIAAAEEKLANATEGDLDGQYNTETMENLADAIAIAKEALKDAETKQDVLDAVKDLEDALADFKPNVIKVVKTALAAAIADAEAAMKGAVKGNGDGQYVAGVYDALTSALNNAKTTFDNSTATQKQVDDRTDALKTALADFVPNVVDKSELNDLIISAETAMKGAVKGNGDGQYAAGVYEALESALANAKTTQADPGAAQLEVNAQADALETALGNFKPNVVSKEALIALVADAQALYDAATEGSANGQYEVGSKAAFQKAIDAAQLVVDDSSASPTNIGDAITNLNGAIGTFESKKNAVTLDGLKALIADAQKLFDAAKEGTGNGFYLPTTMSTFSDAIAAAQAVVDNPASTQANVTLAKTALEGAITKFKPETVTKTNLESAIASAETKYNSVTYGTAAGEKPVEAGEDLAAAIADAKEVFKDPQATQQQVNDAQAALTAAVKVWDSTPPNADINKKDLIARVAEANGLLVGAVEGNDCGQYAFGAIDLLQTAVGYAQEVIDDSEATQAGVDAEAQSLKGAIDAFKAAKVNVCKADLRAELAKAQTKVDEVENSNLVGYGNGMYPPAAVNDLKAAINKAKGVEGNPQATQAQVDAETKALKEAFGKFENEKIGVSKGDLYVALNDANNLINSASEGYGDGQYPPSAFTAYRSTINQAQGVYDKATATQVDVNNMVDALKAATAAFEKEQIKVNKDDLQASIVLAQNAIFNSNECEYNNCYPAGSKTALQTALSAAENVARNPIATQAEVNTAKTNLDKALATFDAQKITVNKTQLGSLIDNMMAIQSIAPGGEAPCAYPLSAKSDFGNAIATANSVYINQFATNAMVAEAIAALNEAHGAFESRKNPCVPLPNIELLEAKIIKATNAYNDAKEENAGGQYINGSKAILFAAMEQARAVKNNPVTQEQVDKAVKDLDKALTDFLNSTVVLNRVTLQHEISAAYAELRKAKDNTGDGLGQYPQSMVNALTSEITAAEAVLNTATTQAQLTEAYNKLNDAIAKFQPTTADLNLTLLNLLISTVQDMISNSDIYIKCNSSGFPISAYTQISMRWNAARTARGAAITQADIDRTLADLNTAYEIYLSSWTEDSCSIGTDNIELSTLRVYPTFATTSITVSAEKTIRTVAVVSLSGATVAFETPNSTQATIDVSKFLQGNYVVVVTFNDNSVEQQTIIKK